MIGAAFKRLYPNVQKWKSRGNSSSNNDRRSANLSTRTASSSNITHIGTGSISSFSWSNAGPRANPKIRNIRRSFFRYNSWPWSDLPPAESISHNVDSTPIQLAMRDRARAFSVILVCTSSKSPRATFSSLGQHSSATKSVTGPLPSNRRCSCFSSSSRTHRPSNAQSP